MTKKLADNVRQTTETEGIGNIALLDAADGDFAYSDVFANGTEVFYSMASKYGQKEAGWGVLTTGVTDTIARTTGGILFSTNGGALVDFDAGIKTVICTVSAKNLIWSADTFAANNLIMFDGNNFKAKTLALVLATLLTTDGDFVENVGGTVVRRTTAQVVQSLLLSLLTADDQIAQRKSGAIVARTPTQLAADLSLLFAALKVTGNAEVTGNLTVDTQAIVKSLLDLSGAGASQIKFAATQNPSSDPNTFDDYEEGTWTPAFNRASSYAVQYGTYIKKGSEVTVTFNIVTNGATSSGVLAIINLPFTAMANANYDGGVALEKWSGVTLAANYYSVGIGINQNAANANLYASGSGNSFVNVNGNQLGNPVTMTGEFAYQAAN